MTEDPRGSSAPSSLPDAANIEWLRKEAQRRLRELRKSSPEAQLAEAQHAVATQYGFASWRALEAHIDSLTIEGQLMIAARSGDIQKLRTLLEAYPEKLGLRAEPYNATLLHAAAQEGQLAIVDYLLNRGFDVNTRETGDNTCAMHWAAAAGRADIVQRLIDAGGDVAGHGDDHELEVIGWATCWEGCNDDAHREVVRVLLANGARHHIFSAIATDDEAEVRRIVARDPGALNKRMSRNENHRVPLQFAVRIDRPKMVDLLIALGADPLAVDGEGMPVAVYAESPHVDQSVMKRVRDMTLAELDSAARGKRAARTTLLDLVAALSLGDWMLGEKVLGGAGTGALHILSKRGDSRAVEWLIQHGADVNAIWAHWDSSLTALHLAVLGGHIEIVRVLLAAGANPTIKDSLHQSDAIGWAEFFQRQAMVDLMRSTPA